MCVFSCCLCGPSALTDSKHHFRFSRDAKVHRGRTAKKRSFQQVVLFCFHKTHKYPSRHSPSILRLQPACWAHRCGAVVRLKSPCPAAWSWPWPYSSSAGGRPLLTSVGQGYRKGYRKQSREPTKFAICSLAALSTCFILHSSVQFKL